MDNKLYVGNLSYATRDEDLQQEFSQYGQVASAKVMMDRFGFVEMGSPGDAQSAIEGLNGQTVGGRALVVNLARPREERPAGGGFRNGGGRGRY